MYLTNASPVIIEVAFRGDDILLLRQIYAEPLPRM